MTVDPARTRRSRFRIRDPLFRFWFRFIYGQAGRYELYGADAYADLIEPKLPDFVSETFERLCQRALPELSPSIDPVQVPGNWWYRGREIDVVAPCSDGRLVVGECKFTTEPIGYGVLAGLEDDAGHVDWTPPDGGAPIVEYVLFARSGFERSVREAAAERGDLRLVRLEDVVQVLG